MLSRTWMHRAALKPPPFSAKSLGFTTDIDPANGIALSGSLVTGATDQTGNGHNFTSSGSDRPTWGATSGPRGLPGITFTNGVGGVTGNSLGGPAMSAVLSAAAFTILVVLSPVVVRLNSADFYNCDAICGDTPGYFGLAGKNTATTPSAIVGINTTNLVAPGMALATPQLLTVQLSGGTLTLQRGSDTAVSVASGNIPALGAAFNLGGPTNGTRGNFTLGRFMSANVAVSAANLKAAQRFLMARYGIATP